MALHPGFGRWEALFGAQKSKLASSESGHHRGDQSPDKLKISRANGARNS